jgi:hypothetical protein
MFEYLCCKSLCEELQYAMQIVYIDICMAFWKPKLCTLGLLLRAFFSW